MTICAAIYAAGDIIISSSKPLSLITPQPGWVGMLSIYAPFPAIISHTTEQDADVMVSSCLECLSQVIEDEQVEMCDFMLLSR